MKQSSFHLNHGVIPACDVDSLDELAWILSGTSNISGIVGYKIGCSLALRYGLQRVCRLVRDYCDYPIIYDHQKAGTDISYIGEKIMTICGLAGVDFVYVFPLAGPEIEQAYIQLAQSNNVIPVIGGGMTHCTYLASERGFIDNNAPSKIYEIAAKMGVEHFAMPGNRLEFIEKHVGLIAGSIEEPKFLFCGIGRQGGTVEQAFKASGGQASYAVIGTSIYRAGNLGKAVRELCDRALAFE